MVAEHVQLRRAPQAEYEVPRSVAEYLVGLPKSCQCAEALVSITDRL